VEYKKGDDDEHVERPWREKKGLTPRLEGDIARRSVGADCGRERKKGKKKTRKKEKGRLFLLAYIMQRGGKRTPWGKKALLSSRLGKEKGGDPSFLFICQFAGGRGGERGLMIYFPIRFIPTGGKGKEKVNNVL